MCKNKNDGGKNLRGPFQLIIHLVHPDLRDYSRLKKKGEQFEGGRGGWRRAFKHAEECKAAEMRCINSGKQRKFIYALSTARYKLRASNGVPPILFHPGKVPCASPSPSPSPRCMHLFHSFFRFYPGCKLSGNDLIVKRVSQCAIYPTIPLMESASNRGTVLSILFFLQ